ncbi:MAG: TolC family protein [Planctomycetota bacterium]|jgi:outer membrane protein TolC
MIQVLFGNFNLVRGIHRITSGCPARVVVVMVVVTLLAGCRAKLPSVGSALAKSERAFSRMPEEDTPPPRRLGAFVDDDGDGVSDVPADALTAESCLPEGELSLFTARLIALDHNPDIDAAYARLLASRAAIDEARSSFLPVLSFTHNSTRTFQVPASRNRLATALQPAVTLPTDISDPNFPVTTILNALARPLLPTNTPGGDTSSFSEHASALTGTWIIFNGFIREAEMLAAKSGYRASAASLDDIRRLIVSAVDTAYFQVQLAKERIKIAQADEAFSRDQFEETRKLQKAGRATQADVDNFRVRMLDAQTRLTNADGARQTGRVILAELLGVSESILPENVTLSALEVESEREMAVPSTESWIATALSSRPDIDEARFLLERTRQNVSIAEGLYLPTVSVSGSWGYDRSATVRYEVEDQSSAATLEFRWDLYTGGARRAQVEIARSVFNEAVAQLRRLDLAVQSEVRTAVFDVVNAQQSIILQRESLKTARENRRIVEAGYAAGKETLNRLNEAQRDFVAAQANLALARISLRQAWTDLRSAAGKYVNNGDKETDAPQEDGG